MRKFIYFIVMLMSISILVGCETSVEDDKLISISIEGVSSIVISDEITFTVSFNPENYEDKSIEWAVSDENLMSINQDGKAKAKNVGEVYVYAKSKSNPAINAKKLVKVQNPYIYSYPNLQGYTIYIAVPETHLSTFNPFLEGYDNPDKESKQEAWKSVEKDYNCNIEIVAYPSVASAGSSPKEYIKKIGVNKKSDFDFLLISNDWLEEIVDAGSILPIDEFYKCLEINNMNDIYYQAGSYNGNLYSFSYEDININNVMYYNIGLFELLKEYNPSLQEPAQIFLDGNWTHSVFLEYCQEIQDTMALVFTEAGTIGSDSQEYYAVSGWNSYWWMGLASNDGEVIVDRSNNKINLNTVNKLSAANVVKELYTQKLADPKQAIDQNVNSWNEGKALFNTGDLWFVGAENRWTYDLWGADTRYGYVPWPRANDVDFDEIKVAISDNNATFAMSAERDYSSYGEECTAENIYIAIAELFNRTEYNFKNSTDYNEKLLLENEAEKYTDSSASKEAYIYIKNLIQKGNYYYEPSILDNGLYKNSTDGSTFKGVITDYCVSGKVETWNEAIKNLIVILEEQLD